MSKRVNIITFGIIVLFLIVFFGYAFHMRGEYRKVYDNGGFERR